MVPAPPSSSRPLHQPGALVIRGGCVVTMDPVVGDFPAADVQIAGGQIGDEVAALAAAGSPVSISPYCELLIGYGLPRTAEFLAAGIGVGLSVDTTLLTGNADMFAIMKVTQGIANAQANDEFAMNHRRALSLATIEGARSLGLGAQAVRPPGGGPRTGAVGRTGLPSVTAWGKSPR